MPSWLWHFPKPVEVLAIGRRLIWSWCVFFLFLLMMQVPDGRGIYCVREMNLGEEKLIVHWKFNVRDNWAICTSDLRWELFSQLRNLVLFNMAFRKRWLTAQHVELRVVKAWTLFEEWLLLLSESVALSCRMVAGSWWCHFASKALKI